LDPLCSFVLEIALVISAVPVGGYNLVDVLAGITIAIASLAVVGRCATHPLVTWRAVLRAKPECPSRESP
jgi:hypothetical protein